MAIVAYDSSSDEELNDGASETENQRNVEWISRKVVNTASESNDIVEPEYQMRVPKSAKSVVATDLKSFKSKSGRILLSVPSLDELDSSDENSDEDRELTRKYRSKKPGFGSTSQSTSLLSLLPPTRALIVREGTKPMIPHQLAVKRPPSSKVPSQAAVSKGTLDDDTWDDSINTSNQADDDDNVEESSGSFFSFYQSTPEDAQAVAGVRRAAISSVINSVLTADSCSASEQSTETVNSTFLPVSSPAKPAVRTPSLCPIKPSILESLDVSRPPQSEQEAPDNEDRCYWSDQTFVPGPERKRARLHLPDVRGTIPVDELLSTSNQVIHEVSQDDLTSGASLELMKSVTADESQYVSKRTHEDNDPGKLAHRKHQITWLAFQAQENEIELEKRWAEARRNKASNRAKYGF